MLFFPQGTMFWRVQPTSLVETSCLFRQLPRPLSGKLILHRTALINLFKLFILSHWERLWLSRRLSKSCTHRVLLCAAGQWLFISLLPETPLWTAISSVPRSWEPAQLVRSLLHKHLSSDQQHTGKSRMQLDVSVTPAQERLPLKDPWSSLVSQTSQLVSSRFSERSVQEVK